MQKINNLLRYTNAEIGIVRSVENAEARVADITAQLKELRDKLTGVLPVDEEEIPF